MECTLRRVDCHKIPGELRKHSHQSLQRLGNRSCETFFGASVDAPPKHEAHDLTQAFFERLLQRNYLAVADPQRGRFRAFLITTFKHFLSKEWDKAKAQKRGGGRSLLSLDFVSGDSQITIQPPGGLTAEQIYERQWAITLLSHVMQRLEREFETAGKGLQFERLKGFMVSTKDDTAYAGVASEFGMTESAARMATSRMRRRYRQLLREEIAQTVSSREDVDDEIRQLFITFAG